MTPEQIDLVQASFRKVAPIADTAAVLFYDRLFVIAPELRSLFPEDMTEQRRKLMAMLAAAVNGLTDFGTIAPTVAALAARHNGYGVKPEHYAPVGAALIWTLQQGLGDEFTPSLEEAWVAVYTALSGFMQQAAAEAAAKVA